MCQIFHNRMMNGDIESINSRVRQSTTKIFRMNLQQRTKYEQTELLYQTDSEDDQIDLDTFGKQIQMQDDNQYYNYKNRNQCISTKQKGYQQCLLVHQSQLRNDINYQIYNNRYYDIDHHNVRQLATKQTNQVQLIIKTQIQRVTLIMVANQQKSKSQQFQVPNIY